MKNHFQRNLSKAIFIILVFSISNGCGNQNTTGNLAENNSMAVTYGNSSSNALSLKSSEPTGASFKQTGSLTDDKIVEPLFGITIDAVEEKDFKNITDSLDTFKGRRKLVIRINIDPNEEVDKKLDTLTFEDYKKRIKDDLDNYEKAVNLLKPYGSVMININDSHDLYFYKSAEAYQKKLKAYLEKLGKTVDIWEIGNEVNGDWAGWRTDEETGEILEDNGRKKKWKDQVSEMRNKRELVSAQIEGAYQTFLKSKNDGLVKDSAKAALTLYYFGVAKNSVCRNKPDYEMIPWADKYIKPETRSNLDYVFVSFYKDGNDSKECPFFSAEPIADMAEMFNGLADKFKSPDSSKTKLGFGEFAPECKKCDTKRNCDECKKDIADYIPAYYGIYHNALKQKQVPKYVGGFFYWYFYQDMIVNKNLKISNNKTALNLLNNTIESY